jgi:hypothetical protein
MGLRQVARLACRRLSRADSLPVGSVAGTQGVNHGVWVRVGDRKFT